MMLGQPAQPQAQQSAEQLQGTPASVPDAPIPDAPRPQGVRVGAVTPGAGTTPDSTTDTSSQEGGVPNKLPQTASQRADEGPPPDQVPAGGGPQYVIHTGVNFVEVPFTVKDNKGRQVFGLTWRDVRVYENNLRQRLSLFTVDPFPLSVALVIDQSMTFDNMTKVNNSLASLQGAFTPYDEVAVFTYNNGPRMETNFTGAQSARLTAVLERSKRTGREPIYYDTAGPMGQNININSGADSHTDPNTNATHGTSILGIQNVPRDPHTLNDAILAAATALSRTAVGRRRIIYVISDGREYGSEAKFSQVVKYLNTNKISIYGTLVGDSSLPVVGFLDRVHLPLMMRDNVLSAYIKQTGGDMFGAFRQGTIETSFAKIAEEVRTQYTVGYYTHEPFIDGKYRKLEVKVMRPNLTVIAKDGYYPTASDVVPHVAPTQ
jgi:VWFA-related protein